MNLVGTPLTLVLYCILCDPEYDCLKFLITKEGKPLQPVDELQENFGLWRL